MPELNLPCRALRDRGVLALAPLVVLGALAGPAHAQPAPAAAAASAPVSAGAAKAPDPSALKPFAEVIKDAVRQEGWVPVWRKEDKVWLEIAPERLGQPMLLTVNVNQSVGERGLYASQMGPDWMVEFRRIGNNLQLIARNMAYRPGDDPASREVVRQAFSDSLLGASAVLSAPHPERKSVLVDANFLLADVLGYSTRLEAAYRLPFSLDKGNSSFESVRAEPGLTSLNTLLHFATSRIPAPPMTPSPVPSPPPPRTTPDPRSLFIGVVYSFAKLPEQPMRPRAADPRIGHFTESFTDFSGDQKANQRVHYVARWRLEKKDPTAELSEPMQPIVYWLDRNIPARYREAVTAGVLEWNKAFERIGFKNAVLVRQQPDDASFDTLDSAHASIRWFVGADVGFAIGPSRTDPRTGEILDADIGMSDVFTRGARRMFVEDLGATQRSALAPAATKGFGHVHDETCTYAHDAMIEMQSALDLLEARGEVAPDSPEAEAFVQAVIKDTIMHEVGHTLGLRHNFKASTTLSNAQLQDKTYTDTHGLSGSVMDYNNYNLPLRGEGARTTNNTTLGPYDYWAIEYAYRPLSAETEVAELQRIASRSTEPALAFADDADADGPAGIDPLVNRFDLGPDPLAWYERRLKLSRELWDRVQARGPQVGDDPVRARRIVASGFRALRDMPELVAKYVGGMHTSRNVPERGQAIYQPVDPVQQRAALNFLTDALFSPESFRFRPEFLASAGPDYIEWDRAAPLNIADTVLQFQSRALDRLLSAGTAQRVLDLPSYLTEAQRRQTLTLDEVYGRLQGKVWRELTGGGDIDRLRRNLQREHLKRVQAVLTRGSAMPADAVSLLRWHAQRLQVQLRVAVARNAGSIETRAHLRESLDGLTEALRATMQRG